MMTNRELIRHILFEETDYELSDVMIYFTPGKPLSEYTCEDLEKLVKDEQIYSQQMFKFYYPKEHNHQNLQQTYHRNPYQAHSSRH